MGDDDCKVPVRQILCFPGGGRGVFGSGIDLPRVIFVELAVCDYKLGPVFVLTGNGDRTRIR